MKCADLGGCQNLNLKLAHSVGFAFWKTPSGWGFLRPLAKKWIYRKKVNYVNFNYDIFRSIIMSLNFSASQLARISLAEIFSKLIFN